MKILLFDPPYERLMGIKTTPIYPIGLSYLAAVLKHYGHDTLYINLDFDDSLSYSNPFSRIENINRYQRYLTELGDNSNHPVWNELGGIIQNYSPQVVGISCISLKMKSALKMAKIIKGLNSNIKIILGGHHPQLYPYEILQNCPFVDIIVKGEGETTLLEIVNSLSKSKQLNDIPGIYFRDSGNNIIETEDRMLFTPLDDFPFPESAYYIKDSNLQVLPLTCLMASRGCPFNCSYCATNNMWRRKVRRRSVDNVVNEIKYRIEKQNDRYYNFFDDCFTLDKEWTIEFCDRVIKDNLQINWACISSVNLLEENLFKKMVQAGCIKINLGIESGSERILKSLNKAIDLDYVGYVFNYVRKYKISTTTYFMLGFPTETVDDLRKTQDLIRELRPNWVYANVLIPLPGTECYRQVVDNGLIDGKLAWSGDIYKHLQVNYTGTIKDEQFNELVDETFDLCFKINRRFSNVWRRIPLKQYMHNPMKMHSDLRRFVSWLKHK